MSMLLDIALFKLAQSPSLVRQWIFDYPRRAKLDELLQAQLTAFIDLSHYLWFNQVLVGHEAIVANRITMLYGKLPGLLGVSNASFRCSYGSGNSYTWTIFQYSGKEFFNRHFHIVRCRRLLCLIIGNRVRYGQGF
jgi:hypothetical protein